MITVQDLVYFPILNPISFSLPPKKVLAVVGHNGAGKTTLFHVLLGLKYRTGGSFSIEENRIGYVPERPYLEMEESLHSFLKLHLRLLKIPRDQHDVEMNRVVKLVGLESSLHKKFKHFSKGMLQKALLAQAMLSSPSLIFLDEPMSGLDPDSRKDLWSHLQSLKKEGVSLVFSSHVMEDVEALADQVLEMKEGSQVYFGDLKDWRKS